MAFILAEDNFKYSQTCPSKIKQEMEQKRTIEQTTRGSTESVLLTWLLMHCYNWVQL
jgi:hypothetical protein